MRTPQRTCPPDQVIHLRLQHLPLSSHTPPSRKFSCNARQREAPRSSSLPQSRYRYHCQVRRAPAQDSLHRSAARQAYARTRAACSHIRRRPPPRSSRSSAPSLSQPRSLCPRRPLLRRRRRPYQAARAPRQDTSSVRRRTLSVPAQSCRASQARPKHPRPRIISQRPCRASSRLLPSPANGRALCRPDARPCSRVRVQDMRQSSPPGAGANLRRRTWRWTPRSSGRWTGSLTCSRMPIAASWRDTSGVRARTSLRLGSTWRTRRTEVCAWTKISALGSSPFDFSLVSWVSFPHSWIDSDISYDSVCARRIFDISM